MKMKFAILFASILFIQINIFAQVSAPSVETAFQNYLRAESGSVNTGSFLPVFLIKENTKGNRYLFDKWVKGYVVGTDGVVYNSSNMLLNYDKMSERLFLFMDSSKVIELSSGDIAGFTLGNNDSNFHFERLKNSTDLNFYQPVYKNDKGYSLYKLLRTKLKKADYQTNGIIESGNKYDEYIDEEEYYIMSPKQELLKINFKKKSIEKVLVNDSSKVQLFFSKHKREKLDETFVKNLLQFLNQ